MSNLNTLVKQPMTWRTSLTFVVLATLIIVLIGWLSSIERFPIRETIEYSNAELQFIRVWLWLAIAIGLILPTIALIVWFKHLELRKIFGFYLLVLIIQIMTEQIISSVWLSSLVVVTGTLYTTFRVWQLWQGLQLIKTTQIRLPQSATLKEPQHRLANNVLWLLLLFWSSNLIVLFAIAWSSIL